MDDIIHIQIVSKVSGNVSIDVTKGILVIFLVKVFLRSAWVRTLVSWIFRNIGNIKDYLSSVCLFIPLIDGIVKVLTPLDIVYSGIVALKEVNVSVARILFKITEVLFQGTVDIKLNFWVFKLEILGIIQKLNKVEAPNIGLLEELEPNDVRNWTITILVVSSVRLDTLEETTNFTEDILQIYGHIAPQPYFFQEDVFVEKRVCRRCYEGAVIKVVAFVRTVWVNFIPVGIFNNYRKVNTVIIVKKGIDLY